MSLSSQLPFEPNPASITGWLEQLKFPDPQSNGYELYKVLHLLKKKNIRIELDALILCVDLLSPSAISVIEFIQRDLLRGNESLNARQCKAARLSIVLLELLAFLQGCIAGRVPDKARRLRSCDAALQLLGVSVFHCALSYSHLPAEHWRRLGDLYQICVSDDFLGSPSVPVFPEFQKLRNIESFFEYHLLFTICQPLRFCRKELPVLFRFCVEHCDKLQLKKPGRVNEGSFSWDFVDDNAPVPLGAASPGAGLLFNTDGLVKAARNREFTLEGFDAQWFWDGVTHYSYFAARKYAPAMAIPCIFVSGYDQICLFFQHHVHGGAVSKINSPSPDKIKFSSLELVNEENDHQNGVAHISADDIWGKAKKSQLKKVRFAALKAVKSDRLNFIDIRLVKVNLIEQELIALYRTDMSPKLAVVRYVESAGLLDGAGRALMEFLPGEVSLSEMRLGDATKTVLLLKRGNMTELIMNTGQFATGCDIQLKQGEFRLMRLLEETTGFVRYLISPVGAK